MARPARTQDEPAEIVIADKSPLVLSALRQLFSDQSRFKVVAVASDGGRFLEAVGRTPFDVGVIGWNMPVVDGRGVLQALHSIPQAPRIVVYTGTPDPNVARQVMKLGGAGFCSKAEPPERLLDTVSAVAGGRMVFPFIDVRTLAAEPLAELTQRELELLGKLVSGRTNAQLARELGVSVNTIKFHLRNLYDKLSVRNRAQAVALKVTHDR